MRASLDAAWHRRTLARRWGIAPISSVDPLAHDRSMFETSGPGSDNTSDATPSDQRLGRATDDDASEVVPRVTRSDDDEVDASGKASFPASDPPGWWSGR
jgi:hypothetical protein